jgi:catechol 2,3-dioxygenase-like lactoylglutathione lyase family enzyme
MSRRSPCSGQERLARVRTFSAAVCPVNQTMIRVKDAPRSLAFYESLGLKLLCKRDFSDFSLFFLAGAEGAVGQGRRVLVCARCGWMHTCRSVPRSVCSVHGRRCHPAGPFPWPAWCPCLQTLCCVLPACLACLACLPASLLWSDPHSLPSGDLPAIDTDAAMELTKSIPGAIVELVRWVRSTYPSPPPRGPTTRLTLHPHACAPFDGGGGVPPPAHRFACSACIVPPSGLQTHNHGTESNPAFSYVPGAPVGMAYVGWTVTAADALPATVTATAEEGGVLVAADPDGYQLKFFPEGWVPSA